MTSTAAEKDSQEWLDSLEWNPVSEDEYRSLPEAEKLRRIRHSSAHVMATALRRIDPKVTFATGPATEQGFFYDTSPSVPLGQDDLEKIEKEIEEVAAAKHPFEVAEISKEDAVRFFGGQDDRFKLDILEGIEDEVVTLYRDGDFIDLCAGPHVPHTGYCRHLRLLNVSAAHWRDEDQPSLTRIAGTAWPDAKSLRSYLNFLEEARKRDHRVLGPNLDLFSFHPWAAAALWHPKGLVVRNALLDLWRDQIEPYGYIEILNPLLYRKELFETSGHWQHFQEDMFIFRDDGGEPSFILKPMNCPDTMLFFRARTRSYRELPLRVAEGQVLHRNEATGTLHGIMRTRNFIQDDAHIFLAGEQIRDEILMLLDMLDRIYGLFRLEYDVHLSTRPESYMGELEVWEEAERSLRAALEASGRDYTVDEGEGSFYGPKIDVSIRDSLGREWQCGTFQLDFQLPERFDLRYAAADGTQQRPIVIHRAIFGSLERFVGVIIEHLNGAFPTWLAPVQAVVMPIGEDHQGYAESVRQRLAEAGIRTELHAEDSISYRIRNAEKAKVPNMLILGEREKEAGTVSLRHHRVRKQRVVDLDELVGELRKKVSDREFDVELETVSVPVADFQAEGTEEQVY